MHVDDVEPLLVLYNDICNRDIVLATINQISRALAKLLKLGLSECFWVTVDGKWEKCSQISFQDLEKHIKNYTPEENASHQSILISDYYFKITQQGRLEETKKEYDSYYL